MAAMDTGDLEIPDQILDPWLGKVQGGSTVATLSGSIPMKFGPSTSVRAPTRARPPSCPRSRR